MGKRLLSGLAVAVLSCAACGGQPWEGTQLGESGYMACTELGERVDEDALYSEWDESVKAIRELVDASGDEDLQRNAGFMANVNAHDPQQMKQTAADGFAAACFNKGWDG